MELLDAPDELIGAMLAVLTHEEAERVRAERRARAGRSAS